MPVQPIPEGYHTLTPYFAVRGAGALIEYFKSAFDARLVSCHQSPEGHVMNAELMIGNSMVMIGEAPAERAPQTMMMYMYVPDIDAVYAQAIKAGGKSKLAPVDQFYGDRSGAVIDPAGNEWWIATRKENLTDEEIRQRGAAAHS